LSKTNQARSEAPARYGAGGEKKRRGGPRYAQHRVTLRVQRHGRAQSAVTLSSPEEVAEFVRDLRDADRERVVAIWLSAKSEVLAAEEVAVGSLDGCAVHPRETFKLGLLVNGARLILAHNHPSGDPEPSADDIALTERIALELRGEFVNAFNNANFQGPDVNLTSSPGAFRAQAQPRIIQLGAKFVF